MNKGELIREVAKASGVPMTTTKDIINAAFDTIIDTMSKGEAVTLIGFGSFLISEKKATVARNPQTGEPIEVPEHNAVRFKPAKAFKETVY